MTTIEVGKYVIVRKKKGDILRLTRVTKSTHVFIEKLRFNLSNAIGKPFGLFEVKNGHIGESLTPSDGGGEHLKTLEDFRSTITAPPPSRKRPADEEPDDAAPPTKVQAVTMEDIEAMKTSGASTSVIVSALVHGNSKFDERTDYSKEKYVSKKDKKHSDHVYILAPTIRMVAQTIYRRNPEGSAFLRPDMLSSMLYHASIIGGSKVLIFDESCGLISAAVLQRLDGKGELYLLYKNLSHNTHEALHAMNFNPIESMPFRPIRLANYARVIVKETPLPPHQMHVEGSEVELATMDYSSENLFTEAPLKEQLIWIHERILDRSVLDSLIIASNTVSPLELLQHGYKSLRSSGTVVIYTMIQEEIIAIYEFLEENNAINILIQDQNCREMQILRDRCHPMLQTFVASGYLITATKTVP